MSDTDARTMSFVETTIGKKAVMAATGLILTSFVLGHLIGNLQAFAGREKLGAYAELLHKNAGLLWVVRTVLLASVALHVTAALQLTALRQAARPVAYAKKKNAGSTLASRTMFWSGIVILAFVLFHLLHLTFGTLLPDFRHDPKDVIDNVVAGFHQVWASVAYGVAMVALGLHLLHGVWSMFQTGGFWHRRCTPGLQRFAAVFAIAIALGNIAIPVAVLTDAIRP